MDLKNWTTYILKSQKMSQADKYFSKAQRKQLMKITHCISSQTLSRQRHLLSTSKSLIFLLSGSSDASNNYSESSEPQRQQNALDTPHPGVLPISYLGGRLEIIKSGCAAPSSDRHRSPHFALSGGAAVGEGEGLRARKGLSQIQTWSRASQWDASHSISVWTRDQGLLSTCSWRRVKKIRLICLYILQKSFCTVCWKTKLEFSACTLLRLSPLFL